MLVLTRRIGEAILIDGGIRISIVAMRGKQVRVGIEAPPTINIHREEVQLRKLAGMPSPPLRHEPGDPTVLSAQVIAPLS